MVDVKANSTDPNRVFTPLLSLRVCTLVENAQNACHDTAVRCKDILKLRLYLN